MDCTKCGLPIEGGQHGDNAIVVKYHWSDVFFESERATDVRYAVCVDDPLDLPNVRKPPVQEMGVGDDPGHHGNR